MTGSAWVLMVCIALSAASLTLWIVASFGLNIYKASSLHRFFLIAPMVAVIIKLIMAFIANCVFWPS